MSHPVKIQSGANRTWVPWLIALCLIGIPLLAIPLLFRIDALSAAVLRQIEHRIGHEIGVRVTTARLLSANRMELVLQALPLLRGQIVGNRLMIERPHLEIQRDAAGRWTLGTAISAYSTIGISRGGSWPNRSLSINFPRESLWAP